jgi:hypothetical protein
LALESILAVLAQWRSVERFADRVYLMVRIIAEKNCDDRKKIHLR